MREEHTLQLHALLALAYTGTTRWRPEGVSDVKEASADAQWLLDKRCCGVIA